MGKIPSREEAEALLREYNKEPFHLRHALIVEAVMRAFAREYGFDEGFWGVVGLLHDVDFERYPQEHCIRAKEILEGQGYDEALVRAVVSHAWGLTADVKPEHIMERVLYAVDELTGLIGATAIMRPSKSVSDLEVKSVMKKFKTPAFAAGCSREVIARGAELLGMDLETLIHKTILAMRSAPKELNL